MMILWFLMSAAIMLPSIATAQSKPDPSVSNRPPHRSAAPAKSAHIVKYDANGGDSPLRVSYSDGAIVEIPRERGRVKDGDKTLSQVEFSEVQVADDRVHIGWVADYMICAQSYPCHLELVVFRAGHSPRYVHADHGVVWEWAFLASGKQVVVHSGFPHGDNFGQYTLYDSDSGRQRGSFLPDERERSAPKWVQVLQSGENKR
jgi:hypothetical protein